MWKVEDALEGRISVGQTWAGRGEQMTILSMPTKRVFQLQKFLEETAEKGGGWFDVRMVVLLAEAVRLGQVKPADQGPPQGGVDAG